MKAESIKSGVTKFRNYGLTRGRKIGITANNLVCADSQGTNAVSFKGASNLTKHCWLYFRKLSEYMKEPSEMTNALIAMIGTGIIAPFAIMCSPKKKCKHAQDKKVEREKKMFQALRQPVSAFLAFAFQVPTTVGIAMGLNHLAYKKHLKSFDDELLGQLIPSKSYLKSEAKKALKEGTSSGLKAEWAEELNLANDTKTIKAELIEKIKKEYSEVDIELSKEKLEKLASNKGRIRKHVIEKMADAKQEKLLAEKVKEVAPKIHDIKAIDLVTEEYQNLAKEKFGKEFAELKKNAKLNWFDKFINIMGFSNKKLNNLSKAEKELAQKRGLKLMKKDMPEVFKNSSAKLAQFVKNKNVSAQKLFANKIFWITLATNLVMVAISCSALNWLHPKFAKFVDSLRNKDNSQKTETNTKVEVKA